MVSRPAPLWVVNSIESFVAVTRGEVAPRVGAGALTRWSACRATTVDTTTTRVTTPTTMAVMSAGSRDRGGWYRLGSGASTVAGPNGRLHPGCDEPGAKDGPLGVEPIPAASDGSGPVG